MPLTDFPEIHEAFKRLMAEKEAIRAKSGPLRAKRDELLAKMRPLQIEEAELIARYKAIEEPLTDIDRKLAVMARAAGGRSLSDGG